MDGFESRVGLIILSSTNRPEILDPVHKVSIIPRGIGALGYTIQRPTEDCYLMTRPELEQKITVLLTGRAAEKLVFGLLSTDAADDLAKASDIARDMLTRYGMDEDLGFVAFEPQRQQQMLELARGAQALLDKETLDEAAIRDLAQDLRRVDADAFASMEPATGTAP